MKNRLKMLAIVCLGAGLLPAAYAQGGAQSQPTDDPTAQSPTTPAQTTPPTFPEPAPTETPDTKAQPPDAASTTSAGVRVFAGSIAKQHNSFVLKAGNTAYKLDDQSKAKEYKGKNVQVTGSLNKRTNTIHVEKIEASASM
jgi:hypothetical protein